MKAWLDCVRCKPPSNRLCPLRAVRITMQAIIDGVEHNDISLNNMLCDTITKRVVLSNLDLTWVRSAAYEDIGCKYTQEAQQEVGGARSYVAGPVHGGRRSQHGGI